MCHLEVHWNSRDARNLSRGIPWSPRSLAMARWFLAAGLAAVLAAPGWAQQTAPGAPSTSALTVERIYGQPSLSGQLVQGVQWSPDGKLASYLQCSGEGANAKSDLWAMEAETGERRKLADADKLAELSKPSCDAQIQQTGLGRVAPQRYFWSPKGDALLFVSSGELYWFDRKSQSAKKLVGKSTSGAQAKTVELLDPKISPDGRWVSFVRNYDLWLVSVATGQEKQLTSSGREELMNGQLDWVYPEELEEFQPIPWPARGVRRQPPAGDFDGLPALILIRVTNDVREGFIQGASDPEAFLFGQACDGGELGNRTAHHAQKPRVAGHLEFQLKDRCFNGRHSPSLPPCPGAP